jgi:GAF domain-containing protein
MNKCGNKETKKSDMLSAARSFINDTTDLIEQIRASKLEELGLLNSPINPIYCEMLELLTTVCTYTRAQLTFINEEVAYIKETFNSPPRVVPRHETLCNTALASPHEPLIVPDAYADPRFRAIPDVMAGYGRSYAGTVVMTDDGIPIAVLCIIDTTPRIVSDNEIRVLSKMANILGLLMSTPAKQ